jgi:hypothetical protein
MKKLIFFSLILLNGCTGHSSHLMSYRHLSNKGYTFIKFTTGEEICKPKEYFITRFRAFHVITKEEEGYLCCNQFMKKCRTVLR